MPASALVAGESELAEVVRSIRTVAVVGMKDEKEAAVPAHQIPRAVQARGIRVIPVNPRIRSALGEKAYPDLASVPDAFDTVNVFRRPEALDGLAGEILALPEGRRPDVVWIQTGIVNDRAAAKLSAAGLKVVMDRCLGVYVARYR